MSDRHQARSLMDVRHSMTECLNVLNDEGHANFANVSVYEQLRGFPLEVGGDTINRLYLFL